MNTIKHNGKTYKVAATDSHADDLVVGQLLRGECSGSIAKVVFSEPGYRLLQWQDNAANPGRIFSASGSTSFRLVEEVNYVRLRDLKPGQFAHIRAARNSCWNGSIVMRARPYECQGILAVTVPGGSGTAAAGTSWTGEEGEFLVEVIDTPTFGS